MEKEGRRYVAIAGDVGDERFCEQAVQDTVRELGRLDILVNNAAEQHLQEDLEKITSEQLERTFRTNIFSYFYMTKAALSHLCDGSAIINTTSVTAYRGSAHLLDYAATKGAIVAFTRSLAKALVGRGIRVNGVAPGPIWTPLIPATFPAERVATRPMPGCSGPGSPKRLPHAMSSWPRMMPPTWPGTTPERRRGRERITGGSAIIRWRTSAPYESSRPGRRKEITMTDRKTDPSHPNVTGNTVKDPEDWTTAMSR